MGKTHLVQKPKIGGGPDKVGGEEKKKGRVKKEGEGELLTQTGEKTKRTYRRSLWVEGGKKKKKGGGRGKDTERGGRTIYIIDYRRKLVSPGGGGGGEIEPKWREKERVWLRKIQKKRRRRQKVGER